MIKCSLRCRFDGNNLISVVPLYKPYRCTLDSVSHLVMFDLADDNVHLDLDFDCSWDSEYILVYVPVA